jgi:hypothetical protein
MNGSPEFEVLSVSDLRIVAGNGLPSSNRRGSRDWSWALGRRGKRDTTCGSVRTPCSGEGSFRSVGVSGSRSDVTPAKRRKVVEVARGNDTFYQREELLFLEAHVSRKQGGDIT